MYTKTDLMQHQKVAFDKLKSIKVGALFMEMGTGKTRAAIQLIMHREYKISNIIYFCPVSLKETVYQEFIKHTSLRSRNIFVFDDSVTQRSLPNVFLYIVGIESMSSSKRVVLAVRKIINQDSFIIVDESSYIKSHNAWRSERIVYLTEGCKYKLLLTGTPITNNVQDLYMQMRFLHPGILGYNSFYSFAANHLEYSKEHKGLIVRAHNTGFLANKMKPYVYQVTKEECLDLPPKIHQNLHFRMTTKQRELYEYAKCDILQDTNEFDSYTIFVLFGVLQQITSGFCYRYDEQFKVNPRLDLLLDLLKSNEDNVIIWCKYRYSLEKIKLALNGKYCIIEGTQGKRERDKSIASFGETSNILLAMYGVGSHGLNLTQATQSIFYENTFDYSTRLQAEDRIHRIGQNNKTFYTNIICSNSIDDWIIRSIGKKENLIASFKKEIEKVKAV